MDDPPPKADIKKPFKPVIWKNKPWCCCHKDTGGKCVGAWHARKPTECQGRAHIFKNKDGCKGPAKKKLKTSPDQAKPTLELAKACKAAAEVEDEDEDEDDTEHEGEAKKE
jgi:hypothetical protein